MSHYLFATDFSPSSQAAFKQLQELAVPLRPAITLLHTYEVAGTWIDQAYQTIDPGFFAKIEKDIETEALKRLEELRQILLSSRLEATALCRRGHAGKSIVTFAREAPCNLIVLGNRGLGGAGALLLGSTSRYVLHHAPCPVLVVPSPVHPPAILL